MRKITLAIFIALFSLATFAQELKAKKPIIMIVPSDVWCNANNCMLEFNNQGTIERMPDYTKALLNGTMEQVIAQISTMMGERGFKCKDLKASLDKIKKQAAEDNMRQSSKTGGGVSSSPTDELKKVAKADIWMQLSYLVDESGFDNQIQFTLKGMDASTDMQIAGATGVGEPSSASVPELMQEAVLSHLDNFNSTLMTYFEDMFENGREVTVRIKIWDDWGEDLETEDYGDDELGILIEDWMSGLTVNGVYNLTDATENMMLFEQVRIPLFYVTSKGKERAYDVRRLGVDLRGKLKEIELEAKAENKGLGELTLWIGHK